MTSSTDAPTPILPPIGIFKSLSEEQRALLASAGRFRLLVPGTVIAEQNEPQSSLFFVLEGLLNVTCHSPMSTVAMGTIKAGETVGEMNVLDPLKASATVKVQHTARVWEVSRENFEAFLEANPTVGVPILREIAIQLTRRIRRIADKMVRQAEMAVASYEWE